MADLFVFGLFRLCQSSRTLTYNNNAVPIRGRAFDILAALVEQHGHFLTVSDLMEFAWPSSVVESSNVRVQMAYIRKALEAYCSEKRYIVCVAGRGYCFVEPVETVFVNDKTKKLMNNVAEKKGNVEGVEAQCKLPNLATTVIGRETCFTELSKLVLGKNLITLVGPAGIGKTTLSLLVAHALNKPLDGNVFFIDLSTVNCLDAIESALGLAVGYKTSKTNLMPGLLEFLSSRQVLLLFDNCEHVIDAVSTVCLQIMASLNNVILLMTSREALRLEGEFVYIVPPLSMPPSNSSLTANQALSWPAVELFMLRANEGGCKEVLSDKDVAHITELCQRLDGNPHAIGLVASRVAAYGIQGIVSLLTGQFTLYLRGRRDVCARQQTVEAMVDWSHNLLTDRDQQVLYRLAIFYGEFPLEAAIAVAASDELDTFFVCEAITNLADKSLVSVNFLKEIPHIRLFETTKAYAQVRLFRCQQKNQIARRHAMYFAEQLRHYADRTDNQEEDWSCLNLPEIGDVRAALEWSYSDNQDLNLASEISGLAAQLFLKLSLIKESKRCCERALKLLPETKKATTTELYLLESLAVTYCCAGEFDGNMVPVLDHALELAMQLRDTRSAFHFLAGIHVAMLSNGRFHESLRVGERFAMESQRSGNHTAAVITKWMLGSSKHFLGHQAEAGEDFSVVTTLINDHPISALRYFEVKQKVIFNLSNARVHWIVGKQEQAVKLAQRAIDYSRCQPDAFYLCVTLCFPILLSEKLYMLAEALILEMDNAASEYKMAVRPVVIHFLKGLLSHSQGQTEKTEFHLQYCVDMLQPPKMSVVRVDALQVLAEVHHLSGNLQAAIAAIDEAIDLAEQTGGAYNLADLLRTKADVLMSASEPDYVLIQDILLHAAEIAQNQSAIIWEQKIASTIKRLKSKLDDANKSAEILPSFLPSIYSFAYSLTEFNIF